MIGQSKDFSFYSNVSSTGSTFYFRVTIEANGSISTKRLYYPYDGYTNHGIPVLLNETVYNTSVGTMTYKPVFGSAVDQTPIDFSITITKNTK